RGAGGGGPPGGSTTKLGPAARRGRARSSPTWSASVASAIATETPSVTATSARPRRARRAASEASISRPSTALPTLEPRQGRLEIGGRDHHPAPPLPAPRPEPVSTPPPSRPPPPPPVPAT